MDEYHTHKECHVAAMHIPKPEGSGRSYAFCIREERSFELSEVKEQP